MKAAQPLLPLHLPYQFSHDGWVNHDGVVEGCAALALWAVEGGVIWLRSEEVAGKSHLLNALAVEHGDSALVEVASGVDASSQQQSAEWLRQLQAANWWLVDVAAGGVAHGSQLALFHLLERAKQHHHPLLFAWRCADAAIEAPELRSRLRSLRQVKISPPQDDGALLAVMHAELERMQWQMHEAVQRYLLRHTSRRLDCLLRTLHQLHSQSISRQMRPSLTNIGQLLQACNEETPPQQ